MRKRLILVAIVTVILAAIIAVTSIVIGKPRSVADSSRQISANANLASIIDGAVNKGQIPDIAAYTAFLRFIAYQNPANQSVARGYLKFNGLGETDIDATLKAADEFRQRVQAIDSEMQQITPSTVGKINQLQKQLDDLVQEIANSFTTRLSTQGQEKMNHLVKDRIKSKMKIIPPSADPGNSELHQEHQ